VIKASTNGCVYGLSIWRSVGQLDSRNAPFVQVGTYNGHALVSGSDDGRGFGSVFHHQYLENQPFSVGFLFACFPQCWRGFRAWPRERHPLQPAVLTPSWDSLFSVFLVVSRAFARPYRDHAAA